MAAAPARSERRRPRPGSLERPVSARMYRGTWLLVALPLLVAAFSVAHPPPLAAPPLPAAFDRNAAVALASDLARSFPDRSPGSPQATGAAQWFEQQLQAYGFQTHVDRFEATIPGRGPFGGLGAEHFAAQAAQRNDVVAVLNLDALGGVGRPRLEIAGDTSRSPAASLVETTAVRIQEQTGSVPARPSALRQLLDLAFPFSLYEQAPFVGRGIPAVTITSSGDRPAPAFGDMAERLDQIRLAQLGGSAQEILGSLDQGVDLAQGTSTYLYLGSRLIRGWAIELVLIAALLPFFAAAVDLFARCRRGPLPLAPGLVALLVVATNAFALLLLLPSLHAWLWLPQSRGKPPWTRAAILLAGFAGPLLLLWSLGSRFGLGLHAPWYLLELTALGYVGLPALVIVLAWAAAAAQVVALAAGRYAPYPAPGERPPRGPIRELIRRIVLARRARRRAPAAVPRALHPR